MAGCSRYASNARHYLLQPLMHEQEIVIVPDGLELVDVVGFLSYCSKVVVRSLYFHIFST